MQSAIAVKTVDYRVLLDNGEKNTEYPSLSINEIERILISSMQGYAEQLWKEAFTSLCVAAECFQSSSNTYPGILVLGP